MTSHTHALGEQARELLIAAQAHHGRIFRFEYEEGGPLIQVGAFERTGADWGRALEELVDKGLVVYKEGSATEHGETFEVIPSTAPSR